MEGNKMENERPGTLPQWLFSRYGGSQPRYWDELTSPDQDYWRHEAEAVKRATKRGGFKTGTVPEGSDQDRPSDD